MAYYTVAGLLHGGSLDGSTTGPLGIEAKDMTPGVWDFIFRKGSFPTDCSIPKEKVEKLRHEFEFWYPMNLRVSGKDLIRNHLTMCHYNHDAVW
jgi:leucyl-tRNA synthetase